MDQVERAYTFVGFKPTDKHVEKKLQGHLDMIKINALDHIKKEKNATRVKREKKERYRTEREINSSNIIKRYMFQYKIRMGFYRMWQARRSKEGSTLIQRVWRGIMGRKVFNRKMAEWRHFLSNAPSALNMQKLVRGHLVRIHHPLVSQAMRDLYSERAKEAEAWVSVRFQAKARRFLAKKRTIAWREVVRRRDMDEFNAILIMQMLGRRYNAKKELFQRKFEKIRREQLENRAASKIQNWYYKELNRYLSKLSGKDLQKAMNKTWRMTLMLQKMYRSYKGREKVHKLRIAKAVNYYAAIMIQKHFRQARVLHWKDMRLNVIAAYALDRHYIERRESVAASRLRYKAYVIENRRDSASNSDDPEDADADAIWVEHTDYKKNRKYWVNEASKTITYDPPAVPFNAELSLIGMRIKVFWPVAQLWYEGTITDFHKRKKRHRVEYDDGDHEHLDLKKNEERCQVQLDDGSWIMMLMMKPPGEQEEMAKKEAKADEIEFKKQAMEDAMTWKIIQDDHSEGPPIYISTKTGEIRAGTLDATTWVIHEDEFGYPCFYNMETDDTVYVLIDY